MKVHWLFVALPMVLLLALSAVRADPYRDTWYFSGNEIEAAYRYQLNFGERIANPLRGRNCLFGEKKILVSHRGQQFWLSCHFVAQTISHLSQMLDAGAAKY